MADKPVLTTTSGAAVPDNQNSITAGARGPLLMQDYQLLEKLAHQNRERTTACTMKPANLPAFDGRCLVWVACSL